MPNERSGSSRFRRSLPIPTRCCCRWTTKRSPGCLVRRYRPDLLGLTSSLPHTADSTSRVIRLRDTESLRARRRCDPSFSRLPRKPTDASSVEVRALRQLYLAMNGEESAGLLFRLNPTARAPDHLDRHRDRDASSGAPAWRGIHDRLLGCPRDWRSGNLAAFRCPSAVRGIAQAGAPRPGSNRSPSTPVKCLRCARRFHRFGEGYIVRLRLAATTLRASPIGAVWSTRRPCESSLRP